jgi:hypothetical protein
VGSQNEVTKLQSTQHIFYHQTSCCSFSTESTMLPNCNLSGFIRMWNLVTHIEGGTNVG